MRGKFAATGATPMSPETWLPAALLLGYLLGSIPFGLILTKLAGTQDLRSIGSGNIGATNVLRTGRKGLAAATLLCDMLKGTAAVIIAGYYGGPNAAMLAALGALDRKSTRLNSSHSQISYAVFCLKKKKKG